MLSAVPPLSSRPLFSVIPTWSLVSGRMISFTRASAPSVILSLCPLFSFPLISVFVWLCSLSVWLCSLSIYVSLWSLGAFLCCETVGGSSSTTLFRVFVCGCFILCRYSVEVIFFWCFGISWCFVIVNFLVWLSFFSVLALENML